eukprot:g16181.t1
MGIPELLWSRGIARSCDVFPSHFWINEKGHEVGDVNWSSVELEEQIVYVPSMDMVEFMPRFNAAPPSARITLVTGQEDVGVPCELFRATDFARPEFHSMLGSSWRPVPWTRFLQLLGLVSFVAAPWGHGLDTHRVWEALMMGSVPVVLSSPLDVLYEQFPVIILQSWQEAQPNSTWHWRRKILRKWGRQPFSRVQAKLRTRFWTDLIRERHQAALRS